jgi:hypothetical protein
VVCDYQGLENLFSKNKLKNFKNKFVAIIEFFAIIFLGGDFICLTKLVAVKRRRGCP